MDVYDRLDRQYQMYAEEYKAAALRVLDSAWYILGREVEKFENKFAAFCRVSHCVGLNSGLDALMLSLRALGIGEGDEVIVPSNTFIATVLAVSENKATPVFVEPDEFYNIDADAIEAAITPKTKAILVVHLYGQAANMGKICDIAHKHSLFLVEDCAQAHGAAFNGRVVGSWGDIACFSFYPTKNLGAFGDAGAIVTDNKALADAVRMLRNYGSMIKYQNDVVGVNSRLDEMQAALLSTKMGHVDELQAQKQSYAAYYLERLADTPLILPQIRQGATHVWHQFVIRTPKRQAMQQYLREQGIHTLVHYPIPPHLQPCYRHLGFRQGDFPIAERYANEVISLPIYNGMTIQEQDHVITAIHTFFK